MCLHADLPGELSLPYRLLPDSRLRTHCSRGLRGLCELPRPRTVKQAQSRIRRLPTPSAWRQTHRLAVPPRTGLRHDWSRASVSSRGPGSNPLVFLGRTRHRRRAQATRFFATAAAFPPPTPCPISWPLMPHTQRLFCASSGLPVTTITTIATVATVHPIGHGTISAITTVATVHRVGQATVTRVASHGRALELR